MTENFEVPAPILNRPYDPPVAHWKISPDRPAIAFGHAIVTGNEPAFARIDGLPRENWLREVR